MQDSVESRENFKETKNARERDREVDQKLLDYLEENDGYISSPTDLKPQLMERLGETSEVGVLNSLGRTGNRGETFHTLGSITGDRSWSYRACSA